MDEDKIIEKLNALKNGEISLGSFLNLGSAETNILGEIGYMYFQEGRYEEAKLIFLGLHSLEPNNVYYLKALGAIAQRIGEFKSAMEYFRLVLRLNPEDATTWANMGEILFIKGEVEKGLSCLQKAEVLFQRSNPDSPQRKRVKALIDNYSTI